MLQWLARIKSKLYFRINFGNSVCVCQVIHIRFQIHLSPFCHSNGVCAPHHHHPGCWCDLWGWLSLCYVTQFFRLLIKYLKYHGMLKLCQLPCENRLPSTNRSTPKKKKTQLQQTNKNCSWMTPQRKNIISVECWLLSAISNKTYAIHSTNANLMKSIVQLPASER